MVDAGFALDIVQQVCTLIALFGGLFIVIEVDRLYRMLVM